MSIYCGRVSANRAECGGCKGVSRSLAQRGATAPYFVPASALFSRALRRLAALRSGAERICFCSLRRCVFTLRLCAARLSVCRERLPADLVLAIGDQEFY